MIDISKGRYWSEGIQLIDGCTPCSPGCDHCWSAGNTKRFHKNDYVVGESGKFNGKLTLWADRLKRFNTRKPKVFAIWNDLFHEGVPFEFQLVTYFFIATYSKNTYLILTKRPHNMLNYLQGTTLSDTVWHGLTVCNQQEADEKIPVFLQVPGKKFLSIEPMLGPIILDCVDYPNGWRPKHQDSCGIDPLRYERSHIDAVILGGETGAGARPLHPDWVRSVRDQCAAAGVPFFFKQWGEWAIRDSKIHGGIPKNPVIRLGENGLDTRDLANCIDAGNEVYMQRVGRKKAGRELDGRTHDELPWAKVKI